MAAVINAHPSKTTTQDKNGSVWSPIKTGLYTAEF